MANFLKHIIFLAVSLVQVFGQTTVLCNNETAALGSVGDNLAWFNTFNFVSAGCGIDVTDVSTNAVCDLNISNLATCQASGGQHHTMALNYLCSQFTLLITGLNLCIGASCDVDNVAQDIIVGAEPAIQAATGSIPQSNCTTLFYPTNSAPSFEDTVKGQEMNPDILKDEEDENGSDGRDVSFMGSFLVSALSILFLI